MKWFKKASGSNKFFLTILPLALIIAGFILYSSSKKFLAEKSCGCSLPGSEASGEFESAYATPIFNNRPVEYNLAGLPITTSFEPREPVLGVSAGEKWIEIDLSDQRLYAHEGDRVVWEFLISSGKWAPTPVGEYRVWIKLLYTKMEGGRKENNTYYYLPNVPYTQYFFKDFGLHGTYWHNNFGHPMSHGCVNLATPDAERLFYWTSPSVEGKKVVHASKDQPGTRVVIHQ